MKIDVHCACFTYQNVAGTEILYGERLKIIGYVNALEKTCFASSFHSRFTAPAVYEGEID